MGNGQQKIPGNGNFDVVHDGPVKTDADEIIDNTLLIPKHILKEMDRDGGAIVGGVHE